MKFHPLANLFPLISKDELSRLADDIKQRRLDQPIVTYEGRILDGRNRWLACRQAGRKPRFKKYIGADALGFVLSANQQTTLGGVRRRVATGNDRATGCLRAPC